jgi:hypothetical protein
MSLSQHSSCWRFNNDERTLGRKRVGSLDGLSTPELYLLKAHRYWKLVSTAHGGRMVQMVLLTGRSLMMTPSNAF